MTTGLLGLAVGDAVGVPAEFRMRSDLDADPVTDMVGYGTHDQPPGTWSDDTSLTLGLAESLIAGFDVVDQAQRLVAFVDEAHWTAHGRVFDIGVTTSTAVRRLRRMLIEERVDELFHLRTQAVEQDNGNGALMRIFPMYALLRARPLEQWLEPIWLHSALTHGHLRSALCCLLYLRVIHHLDLAGDDAAGVRVDAVAAAQQDLRTVMAATPEGPDERYHLDRLLHVNLGTIDRRHIVGSGYVVQSLEAALWALLSGENYRDVVLRAVNLGGDTDTTACIAGGLAAIAFGVDDIPGPWLDQLVRAADIRELGRRLEDRMH